MFLDLPRKQKPCNPQYCPNWKRKSCALRYPFSRCCRSSINPSRMTCRKRGRIDKVNMKETKNKYVLLFLKSIFSRIAEPWKGKQKSTIWKQMRKLRQSRKISKIYRFELGRLGCNGSERLGCNGSERLGCNGSELISELLSKLVRDMRQYLNYFTKEFKLVKMILKWKRWMVKDGNENPFLALLCNLQSILVLPRPPSTSLVPLS
jgi:hypothetical protein